MNMYRPHARDAAASWRAIRAHNAGLIDLTPGALEAVHLVAVAYDINADVSSTIIARARTAIAIDRARP